MVSSTVEEVVATVIWACALCDVCLVSGCAGW